MKNLLTIMCILLSAIGATGCEEKENGNTEQTFEVTNLKGMITFREDNQKWYILVHKEGTYDEVQVFFPSNLDDTYKIPNTKVVFSGIASNLSTDFVVPAGTYFFEIKLSFISTI
jgi:hypothetical protein